jgi:signal transduction histidine kinase/ligand-binding sensor domain-containing protein
MGAGSNFRRCKVKAVAARLILLVFIAAALGHRGIGQPLNHPIKSLYHTRWTVRDGAPSDIVAIQQTPDGYLWLGTGEGLFRFDGVSFQRYRPSPENELFSGRISALLATSDGGLWIAHQGRGVRASYLKNGEIQSYASPDSLHAGNILAFAQSPDGTMWAATDYGLERLEGTHWMDVGPHYDLASSYPETVFVDHRGTLWANTRTGLLYRTAGQSQFQTADATISENVDITESHDGSVWMASVRGWVRRITRPDGSLVKEQPLIVAKSLGITFTRDGALWITTVGDGLLRMPFASQSPTNRKTSGKALEHFTERDGLLNDFSDTVFEDRENNVWITSSRGLDRFRLSKLIPVELAHGATYISMVEDPSGGLLVGTESLMHTVDGIVTRVRSSPSRIECAYRDPLDRVWLGGVDGLWRLSNDRLLPNPLPGGLTPTGHNVQAITLDRAGSLWVSFDRNGVYRLKGGSWVRSGGLPNFPGGAALIETTDAKGRIWFGYRDNLLAMLDGTKISLFTPQQGVNIGNVISIYEADGRIWIAGDKGLEVLQNSRFYPVPAADSEALKGISGIAVDARGDMWLNSLPGIMHITANEIQRALANDGYAIATERLDYLDGLVSAPEQIRPLPSVVKTRDGRIYFATRSSVVWIDPRQIPRNTIRPIAGVESINADGKTYDHPKQLHLNANIDNLEISYTAPSLLIPERVHFRYLMEGLDKKWIDAGDRRLAMYSRIPPGNYLFKVIASNDEGLWSESASTVNIGIPPSFIQGIWFKILCTLAVLLLLSLIYVLRFRQVDAQIRARLHERVVERERIARELHDTFLQGIQGLLLRVNTTARSMAPESSARKSLEETLNQSNEVMLTGRRLVQGLRGTSRAVTLIEELEALGRGFQGLYATALSVSSSGKERPLNPVVADELFKVGREAISNAFRHAQAKSILVELDYRDRDLKLLIRDNGVGIDQRLLIEGKKAGHWGLPGMRERVARLNGNIRFESRQAMGTTVEVKIPAYRAYRRKQFRLPRWLSLIGDKDRYME